MGSRAIIVFRSSDKTDTAPAIYLHWDGRHVEEWLGELKKLMKDREDDVGYAAARFAGICHTHIEGNTGLGLLSGDFTTDPVAESHGDYGVFIVNAATFAFEQHGASSGCFATGRQNK
jgi:hypothetical protein